MKKIVLIIVLLISLIANAKVFLLDKYMYVGEKKSEKKRLSQRCGICKIKDIKKVIFYI